MSHSVTSSRSSTSGRRDKLDEVISRLRSLARSENTSLNDDQLRKYVAQLFNPGPNTSSDEVHSTVNRALRQVQRHKNTNPQVAADEQARCAELVSRAIRSKVSRRSANFLTFLSHFAKLNIGRISQHKTAEETESENLESSASSKHSLREDILPAFVPNRGATKPQEPQATKSYSDIKKRKENTFSGNHLADQVDGAAPTIPKILGRTPRERQEHAECLLVRDVLFAFQGIEGHFIKFKKSLGGIGGSFVPVTASTSISFPMRDLACRLCEMGWLFQHVSKHIRQIQNNSELGVVSQCFAYALQDELTEYFRFVAVLEAQNDEWQAAADDAYVVSRKTAVMARQLPASAALPLSDRQDALGGPTGSRPAQLSLRRLHVWSRDPLRRLRLMAEIVDSVGSLRGGALASAMHAFTKHGDEFVSSFVERLMQCVSVPIFKWIRQWIFYGELVDAHEEFFVSAVPGVPLERLWFDRYKLNASMVPAFIGRALAQEIMLIGKTLIFVRHCCQSTKWLDNEANNDSSAGHEEFEYKAGQGVMGSDSQTAPLVVAIRRVGVRTNNHLRTLLFDEFKLLRHCRALKQYLLLGQGDMIQYLMDLLSAELDKPATRIHRHNFSSQLETAIRASNAANDPDEVLQRLDVRILEASPGDSGWDVFLLTYRLDQPLNSVITAEAMQRYHQIFKFLWKLKRVEYILSSAWKKHTTAAHQLRDVLDIHQVTHPSNLLRHEMIHFVSNLHSYIMFEVLETSWNRLERDLMDATDLDCIIQAHDRYLNSVLNKTLIGSGANEDTESSPQGFNPVDINNDMRIGDSSIDIQQLRERLDIIFNLVIRFCDVQDQLYDRSLAAVRDNREAEVRAYRRAQEGRWGDSSEHPRPDMELVQQDICAEFASEIQNLSVEYHDSLKLFLTMLQPAASENLRFLTFRLDFNLYYTSGVVEA